MQKTKLEEKPIGYHPNWRVDVKKGVKLYINLSSGLVYVDAEKSGKLILRESK